MGNKKFTKTSAYTYLEQKQKSNTICTSRLNKMPSYCTVIKLNFYVPC